MAVGDSITAGFAARGLPEEDRDIAFPVGKGTNSSVTLPWLLEQYSQKVEGQSTKAVMPIDVKHLPWNDYHNETDNMNVAETSAHVTYGSLAEQWRFLTSNFQRYENFEKRWKVLTVWMTANDACIACSEPVEGTAMFADWESRMQRFLENVTGTLRNTYVSLVSTLNISHVAKFNSSSPLCQVLGRQLHECPCLNKGTDFALSMLDRNIFAFNRRLHRFAADWRTNLTNRSDVAIVVQPFLEGFGADLKKDFLSTFDCFHPSITAHQDLAIGLWNSMLCTGDRKTLCGKGFAPGANATCPTKDSAFYTGNDERSALPLDPRHELVV